MKLLGYQPVIEKYVRASNVVLSASKREGLPFNVIEAMLTKRPVVVSVNRGHKELVIDGETGFITDDTATFANAVIALYQDKTLYERIAENAFEYAQNYTIKATMCEFKELLGGDDE